MAVAADSLTGGFAQPVYDSQAVFRLMMDGMARPGTVKTVTTDVGAPAPLGLAAGAIALALCDHDTPVWLSAALQKSAVPGWVSFHSGATITREKAEARFAFIEAGTALPSFGLFASGTQEYPDRSATLVIAVERLGKGADALVLEGPGIRGRRALSAAPLPADLPVRLLANRALFPLGVDLVLVAPGAVAGLPRSITPILEG